jgi:hypothetical protein
MHGTRGRFSRLHVAGVAGTLALAGCVPSAYVYDDAPTAYYGGGYAYQLPPAGYYAYPGHYAAPGYYAPVYAPPRVVYVDHEHRGDDCRHESHREQRSPGDRDGQDRGRPQHDRNDHQQGSVRGVVRPADRPAPDPNRCSGRKCGSVGAAPSTGESQDPRAQARRGLQSRTENQRDQD